MVERVSLAEMSPPVAPAAHRRAGVTVARLAAIAGLLLIAGIHLNLYAREEYRFIPTIGWLFLLTGITGVVLAAALVVTARSVAGLAAAAFAGGVLGGYLLSLLLPAGIFLFKEPGVSYSGALSIAAEVVVIVAGLELARRARRAAHAAVAASPGG